MDSSALLLTKWSSLCQRPSCTLLFTAFMKLKLLYTFGDGKSRKNFQGGKGQPVGRADPALSLNAGMSS